MASSSSISGSRALRADVVRRPSFLQLVGLVLVSLLALELGFAVFFSPPLRMVEHLADYRDQPRGGPELIIFGSCLAELVAQSRVIAQELPAEAQIHVMAAAATGPCEWTIVLAHHIPTSADVKAVLVLHGQGDLVRTVAPWESQLLDLAVWSDMPGLIADSCNGPACAVDLVLRNASRTYRHRGYLARMFWEGVRSEAPIPEEALSPGLVALYGAQTPAPSIDLLAEEAYLPLPGAKSDDGQPSRFSGPDLGWYEDLGHNQEGEEAAIKHLGALLALSRERDIPMYFMPIPCRADVTAGDRRRFPGHPSVERTLEEGGGLLLPLLPIPDLTEHHFSDDVHPNTEGQEIISREIGKTMRRVWAEL